MNIIEVNQLTKKYGEFTAINNVNLCLESHKIYGLLGRNGAGKTTLMKLLTAHIFPTNGELKVFGELPFENNNILSRICLIGENQKYPELFRVKDVLHAASLFFPNWDQKYAEDLLNQFRLSSKRRIKKLSRGMLSSVGIIVGLASRAPLTIFDEPYVGLDVVGRKLFYDQLIEDYGKHPRTILLSTHLIDEVSQLLEHIIVIDQGEILIDNEVDHLRELAFTLYGTKEEIEKILKDKELLSQATIGSLYSATFLGQLSAEDSKLIQEKGLQLEPISLQQLIIYLTKRRERASQ